MTANDPELASAPSLRDQAQAWLVRLTSGSATQGDANAFRRWCALSPEHVRAFVEARQMWQLLGQAASLQDGETRALPADVLARGRPRVLARRAFLGGALAAGVGALMLSSGRMTFSGGAAGDYRTEVGEQRQVRLDASTVIEMNTATRLNVHHERADSLIELLGGEAEIDTRRAAAGELLRVAAGNGCVVVREAQFNMRMIEGRTSVACLSGQLEIDHLGRRFSLASGQRMSYDETSDGAPEGFDRSETSAWRQGMLVFNDAPMAQVVEEINRYRPGLILLVDDALARRVVQARFSVAQLSDVAALIRNTFGVRVRQLPGGVVLLG
ncbi:MAG: DUF4880 domain-containing protein [Paucimonas sp.]|jgi:ferric-dicitrate binding protein FerR (iron transport regulator)|nr:DUF4880 domain-containing protein [Paucimonas sp.]